MFINQIRLENFKIYYDINELKFTQDSEKNISIISGNNGYGKTTLLMSLVWCLYGKLLIDVDDDYKREVYNLGGYKKFASSNLNRLARKNGITIYSVKIVVSGIHIPSIPADEVSIKRTFDTNSSLESVEILIDGNTNELTKEVGPEFFINDFILPREIAKFFFFDAEKIVSLSEISSYEDKRKLSKAYSEVLGIKKYEDLKINLQDLRIRLRKNHASTEERKKFTELQDDLNNLEKNIKSIYLAIESLKERKVFKKNISDEYQEKLIREGSSISIEELNNLREIKNKLDQEAVSLKSKLKDLLDLAPFAILLNQLVEIKTQLNKEKELAQYTANIKQLKKKIKEIEEELTKRFTKSNLNKEVANQLLMQTLDILRSKLIYVNNSSNKPHKILHDFSNQEFNEFEAIIDNIKNSFTHNIRQINKEYKNNRSNYYNLVRKLNNTESKESDLLIKEIRNNKIAIDLEIEKIDDDISVFFQNIGQLQNECSNKAKLLSEISKKIQLQETDVEKDTITKRLIDELDEYIIRLKLKKKASLEKRLLKELSQLMHKSNFISKVYVEVGGEIIDINLFDNSGELIPKEHLSKGEQQLYATALLKALVDESNINFPVFIDSPLQKFDINHSRNIICDFYPQIASQVVLFPLVEKELTEGEYLKLLPKTKKCYIIENKNKDYSVFQEIKPSDLFISNKESIYNV